MKLLTIKKLHTLSLGLLSTRILIIRPGPLSSPSKEPLLINKHIPMVREEKTHLFHKNSFMKTNYSLLNVLVSSALSWNISTVLRLSLQQDQQAVNLNICYWALSALLADLCSFSKWRLANNVSGYKMSEKKASENIKLDLQPSTELWYGQWSFGRKLVLLFARQRSGETEWSF